MAKLRQFERVNTDDPKLNRIQEGMEEALRPVFSSEILGGKLITHEFLTNKAELVFHGLGREPKGWIRVRAIDLLSGKPWFTVLEVTESAYYLEFSGGSASAAIKENPDPTKFITMDSGIADIKVSFWIF